MRVWLAAFLGITAVIAAGLPQAPWVPDNGDGTFRNPVIYADYSDPDVIRAGRYFYLVSSSFVSTPALPILRSPDLVNWQIIGHVSQNLPAPVFDAPQHGKGVWAPSLREHAGRFYVFYGDPDHGIFMSSASSPEGPWAPLHLVREAKGWIDPCPLWDDDGQAYLVHAWAKSRTGFNGVLTVCRMSPDGQRILDEGRPVFEGKERHPTIEGPKFYKRNGCYYIFAPAGGVATGWQVVLRSKHPFGPYEDRIVLQQGKTAINGPHQGGWVDTAAGQSWFVHFQDAGLQGRVVHLQPMMWHGDWPVIGNDPDGDGAGEPVAGGRKPDIGTPAAIEVPQTGDEFDTPALGLQWQWAANHQRQWWNLEARRGWLRLNAVPNAVKPFRLWEVPNLLLQKFPAPVFRASARIDFHLMAASGLAGMVVFGMDYSYLALFASDDGRLYSVRSTCKGADQGGKALDEATALVGAQGPVELQLEVAEGGVCRFSLSTDGKAFKEIGNAFTARKGAWVGARIGLFVSSIPGRPDAGYADVDWFRIERLRSDPDTKSGERQRM
jgi:beta-xylosidase